MKNTPKYQDIVKSCGYDHFTFIPIRIGHIVEFYEYEDMFLKASSHNVNTRGFLQEYNILKYINEKGLNVSPRVISFNDFKDIQIICMQRIKGELLSKQNYNSYVMDNITNALKKVYNIGVIQGDVKADNIIVKDNNEVCLVDFDQAYITDKIIDFELSPDMIGNGGRNLSTLRRAF